MGYVNKGPHCCGTPLFALYCSTGVKVVIIFDCAHIHLCPRSKYSYVVRRALLCVLFCVVKAEATPKVAKGFVLVRRIFNFPVYFG